MTVRVNKSAFNIREKLSELERPIGVKGNELMRAETAQEARDLVSAGRKNLIINGDFRISQRGDYTSSAVTAGHDSYWLDRWMSLKNGTTSTVQRVTRTVNGISQYVARIECTVATTGATGIFGFAQRVELSSIPVGRTLTASAWVRTNHPYVGFRTNTFQGSGGDRGVKVTPDGNWHRIYWTFDSTGTTNSAVGGDILIVAYNNTSVNIAVGDYIEIAEVQLEVGKNATEFEHRSYGEEFALCQRYFQSIGNINFHTWGHDIADTTGMRIAPWSWPGGPMRVSPTLSYDDGNGNANRFNVRDSDEANGSTNVAMSISKNQYGILTGFKYPYAVSGFSKGQSGYAAVENLTLSAEL